MLALAWRSLPGEVPREAWERALVLAGIVGLHDPPRPEVPQAVATCRAAGIRVIMITGDHPRTAARIAVDLGIVDPGASAVELKKCTFDVKTGAVHMEADAKSRRGADIHYVIDGKVEGNTMTGSWNHDNRKGDFKITKK